MRRRFSRRSLLRASAQLAGATIAAPHLWIPSTAHAQTAGRGAIRHLVYIRLAGAFRFTATFNGDVDSQFNPFGKSDKRAPGTEWGVSKLLEKSSTFLDGDANKVRRDLGMKSVAAISNDIAVLPCVDHEPASAGADGNHGTGLERYLTGYVGGATSFFTYINYGLRDRPRAPGQTLLPAFSLGEAGMALGAGVYAAYRPPVLDGEGFDRFSLDADANLPPWASRLADGFDARMQTRLHTALKPQVSAYRQSRQDTRAYGQIFRDPLLKTSAQSGDVVDGISNRDLATLFGEDGVGQQMALGLRLFHFGCPAVFLNQGSYDMHSDEDDNLPTAIEEANRLISGLNCALKKMTHPDGGTYWDKTLVVLGSEFGRTTGNSRFNSAGGSDHNSDLATRWMSMPMMGGLVKASGKGGKLLGQTRGSDLRATGQVYSYRTVMKTLLDFLGADHVGIFPNDPPSGDLFA